MSDNKVLLSKNTIESPLQWALTQVHNKAYGRKSGLCLDKVYPTLHEECEKQEKKIQDLETKLAKAVEACNDLLFHCEDYGVKEESLAILMACEKTRKTLEEIEKGE